MIIRSKAPLRIGLAGGGTDVSPYSDLYGGAILNATISLFASASIEPLEHGRIEFHALDKGEIVTEASALTLAIDGKLDLLKGIYNRVVKDFTKKPVSFRMTTYVDVTPGSGCGTNCACGRVDRRASVLGAGAGGRWHGLAGKGSGRGRALCRSGHG